MSERKKIILLAGGTGFIGKSLAQKLALNHEVRILTRQKESLTSGSFYWNPEKKEIDDKALVGVSHIINLCGASIADKRWTNNRKKELRDSRVIPTQFLYEKSKHLETLEQYISASGINCYDVNQRDHVFIETDPMASDFVSTLVRDWEKAADLFEDRCKVIKLRISFVLSPLGGSLVKLEKPIRMGLALVLGSGKQSIPWIHLDDLMGIIEFGINKGLKGVYHANAGNTTMLEMTQLLAQKHKKKIWLPSVPGFLLRLVLGKLSSLVLEGIMANSDKIRNAGFEFKKGKIKEALN